MTRRFYALAVIVGAAWLAACSHQPADSGQSSRYQVKEDFIPLLRVDPATVKDAIPRVEPLSKGGNKSPYTVLGETYQVLPSGEGYKARGGASWYGLKFHGHQTSNGETYSVYGMTAAHKTLPIPSYVRVTNLANHRSVIVRVNDRGPFHDGRIIDLSYAAAAKLGYIEQGTAQVEVEWIDPRHWQPEQPDTLPVAQKGVYLQLGAYSRKDMAEELHRKLYAKYNLPVSVESGKDTFHRVKIGPISADDVASITIQLQRDGFPDPLQLPRP